MKQKREFYKEAAKGQEKEEKEESLLAHIAAAILMGLTFFLVMFL